jgi:hypothetical protein
LSRCLWLGSKQWKKVQVLATQFRRHPTLDHHSIILIPPFVVGSFRDDNFGLGGAGEGHQTRCNHVVLAAENDIIGERSASAAPQANDFPFNHTRHGATIAALAMSAMGGKRT